MLFLYENGKCAKVPLSSYETKQNRRKLLKAYSDKAELAFMRFIPEETELAIFTTNNRLLLVAVRSSLKRRPAIPPVSMWLR